MFPNDAPSPTLKPGLDCHSSAHTSHTSLRILFSRHCRARGTDRSRQTRHPQLGLLPMFHFFEANSGSARVVPPDLCFQSNVHKQHTTCRVSCSNFQQTGIVKLLSLHETKGSLCRDFSPTANLSFNTTAAVATNVQPSQEKEKKRKTVHVGCCICKYLKPVLI